MKTKKCSKCKIEKELSMFGKDKRSKDGLNILCKNCKAECGRKSYQKNKDKIRKRNKEYRDANKDKIKKQSRKYYLEHIEERKIYNKIDWEENKEYYQQYREENREQIREYKRSYCKERRKNDIAFKILCNLRGRLSHAIKDRKKSASTKKLIGCSIKDLKQHLQSQFRKDMNWDNYGYKKGVRCWEIDHIIPCVSFDLINTSEQQKCFHYTNLQPLWAKENKEKGSTKC